MDRTIPVPTQHAHAYTVRCYDADGRLKWVETIDNLVTNEGLDDILDQYYGGASYTAAHFVGLADGTPTFAAADTMGTHAGWTEVTSYDEAARPNFTAGTASGQALDNSASVATFTISATDTIGGAFLATDSTKGGTAGTLVGGAAFSADRSLADNDMLEVTITATASSN